MILVKVEKNKCMCDEGVPDGQPAWANETVFSSRVDDSPDAVRKERETSTAATPDLWNNSGRS